jgi:hypothetical protein
MKKKRIKYRIQIHNIKKIRGYKIAKKRKLRKIRDKKIKKN